MTGPLVYLTGRSLANRVRTIRLRAVKPRYLLVYLLAGGYLWLVLLGPRPVGLVSSAAAEQHVGQIAALMTVLALRWWLMEDDRTALAFTGAELTFLFPAPITRSQLIGFKLMRVQTFLLINTLFWTVAARRTGLGLAPDLLRAVAIWVAFGTLYLHRLAAALTRGSMLARGGGGRKPIAFWLVIGALGTAPVLFLIQQWPALGLAWRLGLNSFLHALGGLLDQPVVVALLWPMRVLFRPTVARDLGTWSRAMVPSVLLLAVHFLWVVRADFAFEEAALSASSRAARNLNRAARGSPAHRRTLPLPARSNPMVALAWKNLICQTRGLSLPTMLALGIPLCSSLVFAAMEPTDSLREVLGWFGVFWAGFLIFMGPQWVRYDLRKDLGKMDLLRSYPVTGAAVMAGEIGASALILSGYQVLLLTVGIAGLWRVSDEGFSRGILVAGYLSALLLLPAINWIMVAIYNAGALLFPEWVRRGRRGGGIEAMGQSVMGLIAAGSLLVVALLLPTAAAAGTVYLAAQWLGWLVVVPAAGLGLALLLVEARLMARWLGRRFDRYDPSMVRLAPLT